MQAGNERLNRTNPFLRVMSSVMSVLLVVNLVPSEALAEIHLGPRSPSGVPEETPAEVVEETVVDHTTKQPPVDILSYLSYTEIEGATFNGVEYEVTESTPVVVKYAFEETVGNQFLDDYEYYFRLPDAFLPSNGQPYLDDSIVVGYHDGGQTNYISISNNQWYIANNEVHFSWNQSDGSGFSFMQAQELTSFELRIEGTFLPDYSAVDFGAGYINLKFPDQYADESDEGYEEEQPQQQQPTSTSTVFEFGSTSELVQEGVPVTEGDAQKKQKDTDPAASKRTDPNKPETAATDPAQQAATPDAADATDQTETSATEATDEQAEQKTTNPGTVSQFTYEDDQVLVIANVADPSVFPEGAELKVKPIPSYQGEFNNYIAALNNASDKTYDEDNTILFDIAFFLNGEEIQPANGTVDVTIKFKKYQLKNEIGAASLANVEVNHLPVVDGNVVVESVDAEVSVKNEVAQLNAESFSVYAFSYTVDFVFDGYTYKLPGSGSVTLSKLLSKLGINESSSAVDNVEFSNPSVLSVERDFRDLVGNEWVLVSLVSFDTPETLTVKMSNGNIYVIDVTDPVTTDVFTIDIHSSIVGREWNKSDSFAFTLVPDNSNKFVADYTDKTVINFESEQCEDLSHNKACRKGSLSIKFSDPGPYIFKVYEENNIIDLVNANETYSTLYFNVVRQQDGNLEIENYGKASETLEFVNSKCASIFVKKEIAGGKYIKDGLKWPSKGKASFIAKPGSESPSPVYVNSQISEDTYKNTVVAFKVPIVGVVDGTTYTYTIHETNDFGSAWTAAPDIIANVTVKKNGDVYDSDVKYTGTKGETVKTLFVESLGAEAAIMTNTYKVSGNTGDIKVQKIYDGPEWQDDGSGCSFLFHLDIGECYREEEVDGNIVRVPLHPTITNDTIRIIKSDGNNTATSSFGAIQFPEVGHYEFWVYEEDEHQQNVNYDTERRRCVFDLVDTQVGTIQPAEDSKGLSQTVTFVNTYGKVVHMVLEKNIAGKEPTGEWAKWPIDGVATFTLASVDGAPMPREEAASSTPSDTIRKDVYGPGPVDFGDITFTEDGVYSYVISEETSNFDKNWAKVPKSIIATYTVKTDDSGNLTYDVEYRDQFDRPLSEDQIDKSGYPIFTNKYARTGSLTVTKVAVGEFNPARLDEIEVEVVDASGESHKIYTSFGDYTKTASGYVYTHTFDSLTAGFCRVSENVPEHEEFLTTTYTPSQIVEVKAKETEDQNYQPAEVTIRNTYCSTGDLIITKKVNGTILNKDELSNGTITIKQNDKNEITRILSDYDSYDSQTQTYTYLFRELVPGHYSFFESGAYKNGHELYTIYEPSDRSVEIVAGNTIEYDNPAKAEITNTYKETKSVKTSVQIPEGSKVSGNVELAIEPFDKENAPTIPKEVVALSVPGTALFGNPQINESHRGSTYKYRISVKKGLGEGWAVSPQSIVAVVAVDDNLNQSLYYEVDGSEDVNTQPLLLCKEVGMGTIKLTKSFEGLSASEIEKLRESIEITATNIFDGSTKTAKLDSDLVATISVTAGTYVISESGAELDGYKLETSDANKVNVTKDDVVTPTLKNTYVKLGNVTVTLTIDGGVSYDTSDEQLVKVKLTGPSEFNVTLDKFEEKPEGTYTYSFKNLNEGEYTVTTEGIPTRTGYDWEESIDPSDGKVSVSLGSESAVPVKITEKYTERGKLKIVKKVSGASLTSAEKLGISFWIYSDSGAWGSVSLAEFNSDGSDQYSYTVDDLPSGDYVVTETGADIANYDLTETYSPAEGAVSIASGKETTVTVTNTYKVNATGSGRISISNTVNSSTDSDRNKSFSYKLTLSGDTGKAVTGDHGDLKFTNGEASFTLKDGETKTATNLPFVGYTVTQTSSDGFNTTSSGASGTISTNTRASFTNTKNSTDNNTNNNSNSSSSSSNSNNSSTNKNTNSNTTTGSNSKVTIKLTANKRLTGRTLVANEFSFALRDGNGNLLQTKTNTSSGSVAFDGIDLSAEGTYYYVISEVKGSAADITYDTHQARVTVTVTKDSSGTFTAKAAYDSSNSTTFNNTYTGTGSTATAANGSSSSASKTSTAGTAATTTQANKDNLAKTADPTLFTALPMLATAGAASVVAGVIRRRKRK